MSREWVRRQSKRAFAELEAKGFIVLTVHGNWYHRRAQEWRLTTKLMQTPKGKIAATNEWRHWSKKTEHGPIQNQKPLCMVPIRNPSEPIPTPPSVLEWNTNTNHSFEWLPLNQVTENAKPPPPLFPKLEKKDDGNYDAKVEPGLRMETLMGTRTVEAANAIYITAISALGISAEKFGTMASAMFAELEPQDAVEAMLVTQMTATHIAMTALAERVTQQSSYKIRESTERSMTRLNWTFLAQMDALKKYRAKAQQIVRVERVTVNDGGQAIVGDVSHGGEGRA